MEIGRTDVMLNVTRQFEILHNRSMRQWAFGMWRVAVVPSLVPKPPADFSQAAKAPSDFQNYDINFNALDMQLFPILQEQRQRSQVSHAARGTQ